MFTYWTFRPYVCYLCGLITGLHGVGWAGSDMPHGDDLTSRSRSPFAVIMIGDLIIALGIIIIPRYLDCTGHTPLPFRAQAQPARQRASPFFIVGLWTPRLVG